LPGAWPLARTNGNARYAPTSRAALPFAPRADPLPSSHQLQVVKLEHEEYKVRLAEAYQLEEAAKKKEQSQLRTRFQAALAQYEVRSRVKRIEKDHELRVLRKVVEERTAQQDKRRADNQERDRKICRDEMDRLLAHARAHPYDPF
jgi:predicted transcriptional regulator